MLSPANRDVLSIRCLETTRVNRLFPSAFAKELDDTCGVFVWS